MTDTRSVRAPGGLRTSDFEYDLPPELIASRPAARRDGSRLLVLRREGGVDDRRFPDLAELVGSGDALVLNDTRVFPARLTGRKPTGAAAEILLLLLGDRACGR
ncbi:MAG: S-adenosylmethionine:tRNA ribosyltransferase-isomerase, partial [Gemmatimonadota bacterium]